MRDKVFVKFTGIKLLYSLNQGPHERYISGRSAGILFLFWRIENHFHQPGSVGTTEAASHFNSSSILGSRPHIVNILF